MPIKTGKLDTYGNVLDESEPEWRSFQKRNRDIEAAALKLRTSVGPEIAREIEFYSTGVKCRGTFWSPKKPLPGRPAILVCHGWGGLRAFLDVRYASKFVEEGFFVLSFDYRGWGSSDGKIVPIYDNEESRTAQERARHADATDQVPVITPLRVRVIRQVIDADDQLQDIGAAVTFLSTCGVGKIGIFGSSMAGGHVLEYGARDPSLVKCIISQVPSVGRNGAGNLQKLGMETMDSRLRAVREGWIPAGARESHLPEMDGSPILSSLACYDPLRSCSAIIAPTMVIDAEFEELWDVNMNGKAAFDLIRNPHKEYFILRGAKHYDAYLKDAKVARDATIRFFKKHLVASSLL